MGSYNDYVSELKGARSGFDDRRLRARIDARIARRANTAKFALEGALALLLLVTVLYFNFRPSFSGGGELVADYVYQPSDLNGGQVINYVFTDQ